MASGSIGITDLALGQDSTNNLKSAASNVLVAKESGLTTFNPLTQVTPDLGSHFISELLASLTDIYNFLNDTLYSTADGYFQPEENNGGGNGNNGGYGTGGNGGTDSGSSDTPQDTTPVTTPDTTPITTPDTTPGTTPDTTPSTSPIQLVQLEEIDTTPLEELSLDDVYGAIGELVSLAEMDEKTLDEMLMDDSYSDKIKELVLNSPYISQEFKDVILDLDSSVVRVLLEYILNGNSPEIFDINTLNLGIVYSIFEDTAEEYGITVDELLSDPKYTDVLKDKLTSFGSVIDLVKGWEELSNEDFQEQLKSFYYGDVSEEFPDEDITTTRSYVDYLAQACDVYYEDLLNDASYAETLKEGAVQFGKSLTFFNATSFFSDEGIRNNVSGMFNGTNYKAYGMTEDSVESFRKEIDSLASANNTTAEKLLTDSQYADTVKDALLSSDSATGVGTIYKNSASSVSQNVAKNLYNTSFEESEEQKELDAILTSKQTSTSGATINHDVETEFSGEGK